MTFAKWGRRLASVLCLCTAFAMAVPTALAAPLASEDFSYADGDLTAVSLGVWSAHSGGGARPIQVTAGAAQVVQGGGSGEDLNISLSAAAGAGDVFYSGMDVVVTGGSNTDYFAHFKTVGGFDFNCRVWVTDALSGGDFTFGITSGSSDTAEIVKWPTDLVFGQVYRVVTRYTFDTGVSTLWVDPIDENSQSISSIASFDMDAVGEYALRQDSSGNSTESIDNLCVATTFAEAISCSFGTPTGACDLGVNMCSILEESECTNMGGTYLGDATGCPTGACTFGDGFCTDDTSSDLCATAGGTYQGDGTTCPLGNSTLVINEADADTPGTDIDEFVEIYNTSSTTAVDFNAEPHVLVFYNGNGNISYSAIQLSGTVPPLGYFVVGSPTVAVRDQDICDTVINADCDNSLQNGDDAIALYTGSASNYPIPSAPSRANLVDALVYDTNDGDNAGLLDVLTPGEPQINEAEVDASGQSMQRCPDGIGGPLVTAGYSTGTPTPGVENSCTVDLVGGCTLPDTSCIDTTSADCAGQGGSYLGDGQPCPLGVSSLLINEIDSDQASIDTAEFVELYNTSASPVNFGTTPHVLVFFNGNGDVEYSTFPLTSGIVPAFGYYVIGAPGVANLDKPICDTLANPDCDNSLQNGADAVALYEGASFPAGGVVRSSGLIDAVVYGSGAEDAGLVGILLANGQLQVNENANDAETDSLMRCPDGAGGARVTSGYDVGAPSPGAPNVCGNTSVGACCFEGGSGGGCPNCPGDFDETGGSMGQIDLADVPGFASALLAGADTCADINGDSFVNGGDIQAMIALVLAVSSCDVEPCQQLPMETCMTQGGSFVGAGVPCDPDPCGPIGACCSGEPLFECVENTEAQCTALYPARTWLPDTTCEESCAFVAIDLESCGGSPACTATQWCNLFVIDTNLAGDNCDTSVFPMSTVISIPCNGNCDPVDSIATYRIAGVGPLGGDCVFTAQVLGPTEACNGSPAGATFNLVP